MLKKRYEPDQAFPLDPLAYCDISRPLIILFLSVPFENAVVSSFRSKSTEKYERLKRMTLFLVCFSNRSNDESNDSIARTVETRSPVLA